MFGSKSRHQVAIRGDTCSTVGIHYPLLALSANTLCIFLLLSGALNCCQFASWIFLEPLNPVAQPGKMRLFNSPPTAGQPP